MATATETVSSGGGGEKVRTIQDILDEMSADDRAFHDMIVGAAIDDVDISENDEIVQQYNDLSVERKDLIDFVVGSTLTAEIQHDATAVENFLAHFGVKGMQWGVRRDTSTRSAPSSSTPLSKSNLNTKESRSAARAKVKAGSATLGEAHIAAMKSTGHRVTNALLGDKTYWKQQAIITGVSLVGVGAAFAIPGVLPASALSAVGAAAAGTHGVGGYVMVNGTLTSVSSIGAQVLTGIGLTATQIGATGANTYSNVANLGRAIRGNARINKSYSALANRITASQTAGTKRVNRILHQSGGIRNRNLQHDDMMAASEMFKVEGFLEHFGIRGMKWGVRRSEGKGGTVSSALNALKGPDLTDKTNGMSDAARASAIRTKAKSSGLDSLSNAEMKLLVDRLGLERQMSSLTQQPSKIEKGRNFVDRQLKLGTTANNLISFVNSPGGRLLMATMGSTKGKHAGLIRDPRSKTVLNPKTFIRK